MASVDEIDIAFVSGGSPGESLSLLGASGRESISSLYEVELLLARDEGPLSDDEIASLLHAPCAVALGPEPGDVLHGLLRRVVQIDSIGSPGARYVATMVPSAWLFTLARTNRVFQGLSAPGMIKAVLTKYGLSLGDDFDVLTTGSLPTREYAVQYEESDWDFVQRWMESEGLFYWFEHGARDKLVIADSNGYATPIGAPALIAYRRRGDGGGGPSVWDWSREDRRLPARVALFDYNYRTPHVRLVAKAAVDAARGFGSVMHYNEHFKTQEEGLAVARLRAERLQCESRVFSGATACPRMRAGHSFELTDHPDASVDGSYLLTEVSFVVGLPVPDVGSDGPASGPPRAYTARFRAISMGVPFRPARVTPKPRIHGVMHAHIDADGSGESPLIDEAGRYKVRLPFDSGSATGAAASRWIRMAQGASGTGHGAHQPLRKGAEVLLAHVDGDPDRPVIVGAVPNAHTNSPVTGANASQSIINTHSGVRIEMDDRQPPQS